MAKTTNTPVEFIETDSTNLTNVQEEHPGAFIHVNDENGDDTLYIGDDQVTDKFNIGEDNPADATIKVGNFKPDNYGQLQGMTISEILREMFRPIAVTGVTVSPSSKTLEVGGTVTLTARVTPADATNSTVTWSTSNSEIASVSTTGKVTAKKVGSVTITARAGGKSGTCSVTVNPTPPSVSSFNSVTIEYAGPTLIGTDENLPERTNISSTIKNGSWSDGTPYAGGHDDIVLTMNPDMWGQRAEEGTYTISGSVHFNGGENPKDNDNPPTEYPAYEGGDVNSNQITITVLNPIYINDGQVITEMVRHLVDYRNDVELIVNIPPEQESPDHIKFMVGVPYEFSVFTVKQYNPLTQDYDIPIEMSFEEIGDEFYYVRSEDSTKTSSTQYKINLKK